MRRNLWIPPDLYEPARQAAEAEAQAGEAASLSRWIREAIRRRLEDERPDLLDDGPGERPGTF